MISLHSSYEVASDIVGCILRPLEKHCKRLPLYRLSPGSDIIEHPSLYCAIYIQYYISLDFAAKPVYPVIRQILTNIFMSIFCGKFLKPPLSGNFNLQLT